MIFPLVALHDDVFFVPWTTVQLAVRESRFIEANETYTIWQIVILTTFGWDS